VQHFADPDAFHKPRHRIVVEPELHRAAGIAGETRRQNNDKLHILQFRSRGRARLDDLNPAHSGPLECQRSLY
jgi:hypothetical protein